jgi:hypothetical protein
MVEEGITMWHTAATTSSSIIRVLIAGTTVYYVPSLIDGVVCLPDKRSCPWHGVATQSLASHCLLVSSTAVLYQQQPKPHNSHLSTTDRDRDWDTEHTRSKQLTWDTSPISTPKQFWEGTSFFLSLWLLESTQLMQVKVASW